MMPGEAPPGLRTHSEFPERIVSHVSPDARNDHQKGSLVSKKGQSAPDMVRYTETNAFKEFCGTMLFMCWLESCIIILYFVTLYRM